MLSKRIYNYIKWKLINKNNATACERIDRISNVHVGNYSYGKLYVEVTNPDAELYIGNFCSIGSGTKFLLGADHPTKYISTYPIKSRVLGNGVDAISKGNIIINDDVWIGANAIILSGVHIAQGAVIGAGSVVTKDVSPYAIVAGNPAKVIKYRFPSDVCDELLKIDYGKISEQEIIAHARDFQQEIITVDEARKIIEWMPKKR